MKFLGYRRPDGKIGIRNHVLIIPSVVCAEHACNLIAAGVPGSVAVPNPSGCGQVEGDLEIVIKTLAGTAANPNVYGTLVVGLGCENAQTSIICDRIAKLTNKPLASITIHKEHGVTNTVIKGREIVSKMVEEAAKVEKTEGDITEIILGTECGGSDPTSGLAANPAIGELSDLLVDLGSTSILSETTEFIGAEHILAERGATPEVSKQILGIVSDYENHLKNAGESLRQGNPSPGNMDGGLTTLEEKSLGCIHKGGTRPVSEVVPYAIAPTKKGLVIMDTPGFDVASVTGMAAGGAQIVVFSTGLGTPTGNPIIPVIKITGNKYTNETMAEHIDYFAGESLAGTKTVEQQGKELLDLAMEVIKGKQTCSEKLGNKEFSFNRICNYV